MNSPFIPIDQAHMLWLKKKSGLYRSDQPDQQQNQEIYQLAHWFELLGFKMVDGFEHS